MHEIERSDPKEKEEKPAPTLNLQHDLKSEVSKLMKENEELRTRIKELERSESLKEHCPALTFMENYYRCLWGRNGNTPTITRLSKTLAESLDGCSSCDKTLKIKMDNESYQVRIQDLERQLQDANLREKTIKKYKIHQCKRGARLDREGLAFEGCERTPSKPVSIASYCKKINSGQGCIWLTTRIVALGTDV